MALTKQRTPEQWAEILDEVQQRSKRRKRRKRAEDLRKRDKLNRERHREARRRIVRELKRLNDIVRRGLYRL
jgi:hypothetical protein